MANTTLQLRIDQKTKSSAQRIIKSMGLDLSSAIKVFLTQVIIEKSIPFPIRTVNGFTSEYEKSLIKEAAIAKKSSKKYSSGKEVIKSILG